MDVKRLVSAVVGKGKNKVYVDPEHLEEAESALTREDVRELIKKGVVRVRRKAGHSKKPEKKKKRGSGSRKGKKYSRKPRKEIWMERVRAQRRFLRQLIAEGKVKKEARRMIYLKIKGGAFKGKRALLAYLEEHDLLVK